MIRYIVTKQLSHTVIWVVLYECLTSHSFLKYLISSHCSWLFWFTDYTIIPVVYPPLGCKQITDIVLNSSTEHLCNIGVSLRRSEMTMDDTS